VMDRREEVLGDLNQLFDDGRDPEAIPLHWRVCAVT
jgi:hypothetical protein